MSEQARPGFGRRLGLALAIWFLPLVVPAVFGELAESTSRLPWWLKLFPVLPGMIPGAKLGDTLAVRVTVAAGATLLVVLLTAWLAGRGTRTRRVTCVLALVASIANAWTLQGLFLM